MTFFQQKSERSCYKYREGELADGTVLAVSATVIFVKKPAVDLVVTNTSARSRAVGPQRRGMVGAKQATPLSLPAAILTNQHQEKNTPLVLTGVTVAGGQCSPLPAHS